MSQIRRIALWAGLGLALLVLLANVGIFLSGGFGLLVSNTAPYVYTLILLLIVTSNTRTVGAPTLLLAWLIGALFCYGTALLIGDLFGGSGIKDTVWAPLIEELLKAGPVAAVLWMAIRSGIGHPGASDGLVLGYLVGWGLTFHEDATAEALRVSGLGGVAPWSWLFPMIDADPGASAYVSGHALWTALVGAAIGLAMMWRARWPRVVILPITALIVVIIDHGLANEIFTATRLDVVAGWAQAAYSVLGRGLLVVAAVLIAAAAAIMVDRRVLMAAVESGDTFPDLTLRQRLGCLQEALSGHPAALVAASAYRPLRRALYMGVAKGRFDGASPEDQRTAVRGLIALSIQIGLPFKVADEEQPVAGATETIQ